MPPQSRSSPPRSFPSFYDGQSYSTPDLHSSLSRDNEPLQPRKAVLTVMNDDDDDDDSPNSSMKHTTSLFTHGSDLTEDSFSDEEDDDTSVQSSGAEKPHNGTVRKPLYYQHSHSHTHLAHSAFAPPFYNRPPTPLPPSPSLTSLLRPSFSSTQNSRPNTPDHSSDEGHASHGRRSGETTGVVTPNSSTALLPVASTTTLTSSTTFSRVAAKPIPRASPKVPTYEYYGFTLYLSSSLAFVVYLLWSFLPSPFLHQLGIYYYPNRWWALAIPAWTVMLVVYIYVALALYNTGTLTLPLNSIEALVDDAANVAVVDARGRIVSSERPSWRSPSPGHEAEKKRRANASRGRGRNGGVSRSSSLTRVPTRADVDWKTLWNEGTDAVMDVPLGGICQILYGDDRPDRDEDDDWDGTTLSSSVAVGAS